MSFFSRPLAFTLAGSVLAAAAIVSCGRFDLPATTMSEVGEPLIFEDWCAHWQLKCPTTTPPNFPLPNVSWTPAQWKASGNLLKGVLESKSQLVIERKELEDPNFISGLKALKLSDRIEQLKAVVDNLGWQKISKTPSRLVLDFAAAKSFMAPSGLVVDFDAQTALQIPGDGSIGFQGFRIASQAQSKAETLKALSVNLSNVFTVATSNRQISGVPMNFLVDELTNGIYSSLNDEPVTSGMFIQAAVPMVKWFAVSSRGLHLTAPFFDAASADLEQLIENQKQRALITTVLNGIDSLSSGWDLGRAELLRFNMRNNYRLKCKSLKKPGDIEFKSEWGVKSLSETADHCLNVKFWGMTAKISIGIASPSFPLTEIEVCEDKLIVKNVPILKNFTMDVEKWGDLIDTVSCSKI